MLIEDCITGQNTVNGAPEVDRKALFEIRSSKRITVTGVQLTNASPCGINVSDCSDTLISASSVLESRDESKLLQAVRWSGKGTGNMLSNCRLQTAPDLDPASGVTATGNVTGS